MPSSADLLIGVVVIFIIIFFIADATIFPKMSQVLLGGSCEEFAKSNIRDLIARANAAALGNQEFFDEFKFDDRCVERISASSGILNVKFKSQDENEKFGDGVTFAMDGIIVNPGTYKVQITGNRVKITNDKVTESTA